MSYVWRASQQDPRGDWLSRVVMGLHPDDTLYDLELDPTLEPLAARHASNLARVEALLECGGLWLDNDMVPLRRLTGAAEPWVAEVGGRLEGCAMWFPAPGHRFLVLLQQLLERAPTALLATHLRHVRQMQPMRGEVRVLPFDAWGGATAVPEVWAIHLWSTSSRHLPRVPLRHD